MLVMVADAFRLWSVPGAFLGQWLVAPIAFKLGRLLVAHWMAEHHRPAIAAFVGTTGASADSILPAVPRFWALAGALLFMAGVMMAGLVIPLNRWGWLEGPLAETNRQMILAVAWCLWSLACWVIALTFSPRRLPMAAAAAVLFLAALFISTNFGGPQP